MADRAILALADGTVLNGRSLGASGVTTGELVFNTSMSGYQEILTDPSYARQLVTLTAPHIGNVGVNRDDMESSKAMCDGLIVRHSPRAASNWRSTESLPVFLQRQGVVAICDVDTRHITNVLRDKGALGACIATGDRLNADAAIANAQAFEGLAGMDLAQVVTTPNSYEWNEGSWVAPGDLTPRLKPDPGRKHVVAYDFGVKHAILRLLVDRGCRVTVVPAKTPAAEVLAMKPNGVFLSNGPGDPEPCDYAIAAIGEILETTVPVFGICLGHQLLALACGAQTEKMKFGHHGANHPVQEVKTGRVLITSQNHGFAVKEDGLPDSLQVTHRSLFDDTLQGIEHINGRAFSFQGHPEASPGPHDVAGLFDHFTELMEKTPSTLST